MSIIVKEEKLEVKEYLHNNHIRARQKERRKNERPEEILYTTEKYTNGRKMEMKLVKTYKTFSSLMGP